MAKHTPGPWVFDGSGIHKEAVTMVEFGLEIHVQRIAAIYVADDFEFTSSEAEERFQAEAEANAHLIAAAPDLLAACESVIARISDPSVDREKDDESLRLLRAAIARAKGGVE